MVQCSWRSKRSHGEKFRILRYVITVSTVSYREEDSMAGKFLRVTDRPAVLDPSGIIGIYALGLRQSFCVLPRYLPLSLSRNSRRSAGQASDHGAVAPLDKVVPVGCRL